MQWHLAFFVKNLPADYNARDENFLMVPVGDGHIQMLIEGTRDLPNTQEFFTNPPRAKFTAIVLRLDAESENKAIALGRHYVEGIIDALAILLDRSLPTVCPLVEIRQDSAPDTNLVELGEPGWACFQPAEQSARDAWEERQQKVFQDLLVFMDIVLGTHARRATSLSRQMLYSMKMYRAGAETGEFGLEFIFKWSGLEGLVCGGETKNKGKLLTDRLGSLLPIPTGETETVVKELWKLRSAVVHEALAFRSEHLPEAPSLALRIEEVERLFISVLTFAIANLDKADSVQALWSYAAPFQMPPHAILRRPGRRYAMTNIKFDTNHQIIRGGAQFDAAFASGSRGQADGPAS